MLDTASFWLVGLGCLAKRTRHSGLGGALLLTAGLGYVGLVHERIAGARISGYRHGHYEQVNAPQIAAHILLVGVGLRWLGHLSK